MLEEWLGPFEEWVSSVRQLTMVAQNFPQTAFAGMTKSLQNEWRYLQTVVPASGQYFLALEASLKDKFLPALLNHKVTHDDCGFMSQKIQHAGLGLSNPVLHAAS